MDDLQKIRVAAMQYPAFCWDCANLDINGEFCSGTACWLEYTSIKCGKGHWDDLDVVNAQGLREHLTRAATCTDLTAAPHVNEMLRKEGWNTWQTYLLQENCVCLRGPDLVLPPTVKMKVGDVISMSGPGRARVLQVGKRSMNLKLEMLEDAEVPK